MRVLHVLHQVYHEPCGYRTRSRYILQHQRALGMDVAVVTSAAHSASSDTSAPSDPWPVRVTASHGGPSVPFIREVGVMRALYATVRRAIDEFRPDIVHAHSPVLVSAPALRAARRAKLPFVYEIRDLWENASVDHGKFTASSIQYRAARALDTHVMRRADAVVTISDSLRMEVMARGIGTSVTVVPNGVDTAAFHPLPTNDVAKSRWGLQGRSVLGYVGTFQPYEGLDTLIRAVPQLLQRVPDVHILIVGHGPQDHQLRQLLHDTGLDRAVTFAGRLPHDEVHAAYAAADALIYPRISTRTTELTTPLKPLEAMAMGKCVVISDVMAMRELVVDGVTGLAFRAGDSNALVDVCCRALGDAALRLSLGSAARAWVQDERPWPKVIARYTALYSAVRPGSASRRS